MAWGRLIWLCLKRSAAGGSTPCAQVGSAQPGLSGHGQEPLRHHASFLATLSAAACRCDVRLGRRTLQEACQVPRSSSCASSLLQGWPHWSWFPQKLHRVLSAEVEQDLYLHGCVPVADLGFAARVVLSDGGCLPASSSEATRGLRSKEHPAWKSAEAMTTWRSR